LMSSQARRLSWRRAWRRSGTCGKGSIHRDGQDKASVRLTHQFKHTRHTRVSGYPGIHSSCKPRIHAWKGMKYPTAKESFLIYHL
jgi:hypothetical protein